MTVGGVPAPIQFEGMTPGTIGLIQVNFRCADNCGGGCAARGYYRRGLPDVRLRQSTAPYCRSKKTNWPVILRGSDPEVSSYAERLARVLDALLHFDDGVRAGRNLDTPTPRWPGICSRSF